MAVDTTVVTIAERDAQLAAEVVVKGDLSKLTEVQRLQYVTAVCNSLGLNPLTRPFEFITLNGKLTLYATRTATDQLRSLRGVTITSLEPRLIGDVYVVVATGRDATGREDSSTGAVPVKGLAGEALANAYMKAETKAKRRLTLSLAGLGWTDDSEVDSIPGAQRQPAEAPKSLAERAADKRAAIETEEATFTEAPSEEAFPDPVPMRAAVPSDTPPMVEGGCGWRLGLNGGEIVHCALEEMHAGPHSWHEQALSVGGKVIQPE